MNVRPAIVFLLAALLAACGGESEPEVDPGAPKSFERLESGSGRDRRALLVGVGRYAGGGLPNLNGARNDVQLVARLLRERFGFAEDEIRILVDEEADREGVVSAIQEHLVDGVDQDTDVLFWFSGHGSRRPDPSGAEPSGHDTTLVLHDSRVEGGSDFDDDAFHSLLLQSLSDRIVVVTDACHSAFLLRGADDDTEGLVARIADPGGDEAVDWESEPYWPRGIRVIDDQLRDSEDGSESWIQISACASHEKAYEFELTAPSPYLPGSRCFGLFTHAVVEALSTMPAGSAWDAIAEQARAFVKARCPSQTVQVAGPVDSRIFEPGVVAPIEGISARFLGGPGGVVERSTESVRRVRVALGALQGLRVGSEGELVDLYTRQRVGRVRIARVEAGHSFGELVGSVRAASEARVEALAFVVDPETTVFWSLPVDQRFDWPTERLVVTAESPAAESLYRVVSDAEGEPRLVAPDGFQVWPPASERSWAQAPESIDDAIEREARFAFLFGLADYRGSDPDGFSLVAEPRGDDSSVFDRVADDPKEWVFDARRLRATSGRPRLAVEARSSMPAYVVLLALDQDTRTIVSLRRDGARATTRQEIIRAAGSIVPEPVRSGSRGRVLAIRGIEPLDFSAYLTAGTTRGGLEASSAVLDLDPRTYEIDSLDIVER
ncbi:MAG: caspase family protein [Planctomycetota bacterium]